VTSRRVILGEAVSLSLGRYLDDPAGLTGVLAAIDALADEPRPAGSFHRGDYHRLRVGRYRVLYEITEDVVLVRRIDRLSAGG
jgi:mRNA interferase RelE/StbE